MERHADDKDTDDTEASRKIPLKKTPRRKQLLTRTSTMSRWRGRCPRRREYRREQRQEDSVEERHRYDRYYRRGEVWRPV